MVLRSHVQDYRRRVGNELRSALTEDHTPRETASSFAIGAFITMLPTLGAGLILFVILAYAFDRISKLALVDSVVVFNPVVKWGVYASSFLLGVAILGPVEGIGLSEVSFSAGSEVVVRLLIGNFILAIIATVLSFVFAYRFALRFETTDLAETIDDALEEIVDETADT